ncbi:hypothetical protein [Deinococcus alpinitundrae]|uniref:hypothetical protein n=1 Tax=Deinococcus alpinitundrae TaxID=468913 RepID=UPI00137A68B5|nr:hypothetical protein [Deinococcus alpinitundrae]
MLLTDACTRWTSAQQLASRYLIMSNTNTLGTTQERLNSSLDNLKELARLRREALNARAAPEPKKNPPKPNRNRRKQSKPVSTNGAQKKAVAPAEKPTPGAAAPTTSTPEKSALPPAPNPVLFTAQDRPTNAEDSRPI